MATITEDYVSFEIAKLLKEKGFDEPFYFFYRTDDKAIHHVVAAKPLIYCDRIDDEVISAPSQAMAMKWLREVHNLHISIDMVNGGRWEYEIDDISVPFDGAVLPKYYCDKDFSNYEEATEVAIKYCLENLI